MNYIASMTTYPSRFDSALIAMESIYNQSIKPKLLVVNISEEDWRAAQRDLVRRSKFAFKGKVVVQPCINLKPANKIIPTAQEYKDDIIITFDDDILYPKNRAEELIKKHQEYPKNPIAYRTRLVTFDGDNVKPYAKWLISQGENKPNKLHFPTSVSGNLYPQNFFSESFFDVDNYVKLSHNNDDMWTYFHVLLSGSEFVKGGAEIVPPSIKGAQDSALWRHNVGGGGNDKIVKNLENHYGNLKDLTK